MRLFLSSRRKDKQHAQNFDNDNARVDLIEDYIRYSDINLNNALLEKCKNYLIGSQYQDIEEIEADIKKWRCCL